ncbi:MAG: DUF2182 domain-containing protein [Acidimicrobiales bacterium]
MNARAAARDRPEAALSSYRLLPVRSTVGIVAGLLAISAVGWIYTIGEADSMSGMVSGLGQVGHLMPDTMGIASFFAMWVAMMAAMMCPTLGPVVLVHRAVLRQRHEGLGATVAFVTGYLAVWWLAGLVYLLPYLWFRDLAPATGDSRWLPWLAAAVLVTAGAYQFTRRKTHCRESCGSPRMFVAGHDRGPGTGAAFRLGVSNGLHCLGCCAGLMAVLLVVGLMNLVWMVALSVVFLAEKHWRRAPGLGQVVGAALIVVGLAVAVWPDTLPTISGTRPKPSNVTGMGDMKM